MEDPLHISEDFWRQDEFVSDKLIPEIENEFASIRKIYETKVEDFGFTAIHVRRQIPTPIEDGAIPYSDLKNLLSISKEFTGLAIDYMQATNGFAFQTHDGLEYYGVLNQKGNVVFLCLANNDGFQDKFRDLLKAFHLVFVDWRKCQLTRALSA